MTANDRESVVLARSFAVGKRREDGWCRRWESNPHGALTPRDFESRASASFTTPARGRRLYPINNLRRLLVGIGLCIRLFVPAICPCGDFSEPFADIRFTRDVVAVEHAARFMARDAHRHRIRHAGAD